MQCNHCGNTRDFTKIDHKHFGIHFKEDGTVAEEDHVPYHHTVEIFCKACGKFVVRSS